MSEQPHGITRAHDSSPQPVCLCGFLDPEWTDNLLELGVPHAQIRARKAVLDHMDQVTDLPHRPPSVSDPDEAGAEPTYPRAIVRRTSLGLWRITFWDAPGVEYVPHDIPHVWYERTKAFDQAWLTIGSHRAAGTRLNGRSAA